MKVSERIFELLKQQQKSQSDLAKYVGISASSVSDWKIKGTNPLSEHLAKISEFFGVSTDFLLTGASNDLFSLKNVLPTESVRIPLVGDIACGTPIFAYEENDSFVEVHTSVKADFCVRARGDSMVGVNIYDGDIIFVRAQTRVENGEIAAVRIDDTVTLKRVFYSQTENKLILQSENPLYSPLVYTDVELNKISILGKAINYLTQVKHKVRQHNS